jgi:proteic killer suppression protein
MDNHRVIRSFADAATPRVFYAEDAKAARRLPKVLWPVIRRKLDYLHAARSLHDLRQPPADRLEALGGDQRDRLRTASGSTISSG